MRATCPGASSGRISITTLPWVVSRVSVSSGLAILLSILYASATAIELAFDRGFLDVIEARKILRQIGVAFVLEPALVWTAAAWGALAVFRVDRVNDIHAGRHAAERREARLIELGIVVEVDEHLAGARVGPGHGKR